MQYKIGDHVVVEKSNVEHIEKCAGKTGVILEYCHTSGGHDYLVQFDEDHAAEYWCDVRCLVESATKITITTDGKTTVATLYENGRPKDSATTKCSPDDEFNFVTGAKLALERLDKKINPVMVGGFKVGDRVNWDGRNGTIICISVPDLFDHQLGVEFDEEIPMGWSHQCRAFNLLDGKSGDKCAKVYRWCNPKELEHGEVPKYYNGKVVCVDPKGFTRMWTKGKIYQFVDGRITMDNDSTWEGFKSFDEWCKESAAKWLEIVE